MTGKGYTPPRFIKPSQPLHSDDKDNIPCGQCNGQGWIFNPSLHQLAPYAGSPGRITCPACKGAGRVRKFPSKKMF